MTLKTRGVPTPVGDNGKLNPIMAIESRPSSMTGVSFWLCLAYKEHHFERMLPPNFMALDQTAQNLTVLPLAEELRALLAPILEAEDAPVEPGAKRCSHCEHGLLMHMSDPYGPAFNYLQCDHCDSTFSL